MSDFAQVIIVTMVAAAALAVLVRPLFVKDKPSSKPSSGCDSCGASAEPGVRPRTGRP